MTGWANIITDRKRLSDLFHAGFVGDARSAGANLLSVKWRAVGTVQSCCTYNYR